MAARLAKRWVTTYARAGRSHVGRDRVEQVLAHIDDAEQDSRYGPLRRAARIIGRSALSAPSDIQWAMRQRTPSEAGTVKHRPRHAVGPGYAQPPRRPRGPAFVFVAVVASLLVVVGAVALTSRQLSPPT